MLSPCTRMIWAASGTRKKVAAPTAEMSSTLSSSAVRELRLRDTSPDWYSGRIGQPPLSALISSYIWLIPALNCCSVFSFLPSSTGNESTSFNNWLYVSALLCPAL